MLEYYANFLQYQRKFISLPYRTENAVITFYSTNTVLFKASNYGISYWAEEWGLKATKAKRSKSYMRIYRHRFRRSGDGRLFWSDCGLQHSFRNRSPIKTIRRKRFQLLTDEQLTKRKIKDLGAYSCWFFLEKINSLNQTNQDNFNFIKAFLHNCAINSILKKLHNVSMTRLMTVYAKGKIFSIPKQSSSRKTSRWYQWRACCGGGRFLARAAFLQNLKNVPTMASRALKGSKQYGR